MNNGAEEFESYHPYLTSISLLLNAAFKPCKRRKIERGRQWKEDKQVEKEKNKTLRRERETYRFNFIWLFSSSLIIVWKHVYITLISKFRFHQLYTI